MRFTSHTIHRITRFLVASVVMTMLFAWGFPVDARSTVDTKFYFTKSVMQRYGKTLTSSEGDFRVGIRPGIFDDPAWVKIKLADPELAQLPENFLLVSSHIYEYGVSVPEPDETTKSIWLSMDFDSKTKNRRRPYVWDRGKQTWHELPGKRVEGESTYQFELRFPWATVAILEDTSRLEGPEKIDASRLPATGFQAYSILDVESGRVLEHMNGTRIKHPASLTKIMTAMVMLDQDLRMSSVLTYAASDNAEGGKLLVSPGETLTREDAFYSMLVGSANNAANLLARTSGMSYTAFIDAMDAKARRLGLKKTSFVDPSGLSDGNVTTPNEFAKVLAAASHYPEIVHAFDIPSYAFSTVNWKIPHTIRSTNKLRIAEETLISKTGFIYESLYNLGTVSRDSDQNKLVVVTFGNATSNGRFDDTARLIEWTWDHYRWD